MMPESEIPTFARGQAPMLTSTTAPIQEGSAPLAAIPEGISALDVARMGGTSPAVTEALTNYDRMKKILQQSKEKRY
jgi:hypothetical protein